MHAVNYNTKYWSRGAVSAVHYMGRIYALLQAQISFLLVRSRGVVSFCPSKPNGVLHWSCGSGTVKPLVKHKTTRKKTFECTSGEFLTTFSYTPKWRSGGSHFGKTKTSKLIPWRRTIGLLELFQKKTSRRRRPAARGRPVKDTDLVPSISLLTQFKNSTRWVKTLHSLTM